MTAGGCGPSGRPAPLLSLFLTPSRRGLACATSSSGCCQFVDRLLHRHLRRDDPDAARPERTRRPRPHHARRHGRPRSRSTRSPRSTTSTANYFVQYWFWLKGMLTGDMGIRVQQNHDRRRRYLSGRVWITIFLGFYAIALALVIAVPLAVYQAYKRDCAVRPRRQLAVVPLRARCRRSCSPRLITCLRVVDERSAVVPTDRREDLSRGTTSASTSRTSSCPTLVLTLPLGGGLQPTAARRHDADPADRLHHAGQRQGRVRPAACCGRTRCATRCSRCSPASACSSAASSAAPSSSSSSSTSNGMGTLL